MRYFLIVGEASGDLHASALITALKAQDPEASFAFMGGDKMAEAAGVAPLVHYREVAMMGILRVLKNLKKLRRIGQQVQEAMRAFAPDVVIPVDFADFNLRFILPFAKETLGIPVVYYILPKLWAWRGGRIKQLRRYTDLGLSILPFEVDFFQKQGLPISYIGNPCVDAQLRYASEHPEEVKREHMLLLVPGSRQGELQANLPRMLSVTAPYGEEGWRIVLAGAPGLEPKDYTRYLQAYPRVELTFGDTYGLMRRAHVALVTSGTATLETGLWKTPMIVCYRMGGWRFARWVFERFFRVRFFSLVNLILDQPAVPELLADRMEGEELPRTLTELIAEDSSARARQLKDLTRLSQRMGTSLSAPKAAEAILDFLAKA